MNKHVYRRRNQPDARLDAIEREVSRRVEAEYRDDVLEHMTDMEKVTGANAAMIDTQPELEWYMRGHLLDFLVDTHMALGLRPETLFLAVNLIDRYCSTRVVYKKHYQLVGCTALWIAAKYDDKSRTPTLADLESMCCSAYNAEMFTQMELHVLHTLNWTIGHPTVESFLTLCLGSHATSTITHIARYLCELSLYHRSFIGLAPSILASSASTLALIISGHYPTTPSHITAQEMECINLLVSCMKNTSKSLSKKYLRHSFGQIINLVSQYIARHEQQQQQQQQQQAVTFPPTPPPSSSSPVYSTSSSTPSPAYITSSQKTDLHIQVPPPVAPFRRTEGYITPPCTPADQVAIGVAGAHKMSRANVPSAAAAYQSVPMETTRAFF